VRAFLAACLAISVTLFANGAAAAERAIVWVEGIDRDALRGEIERAIGDARSFGGDKAFVAALGRAGQRGPVGPALADASKRDAAIARIARAGRDAGVDEIVVVIATRGPKGATHARVLVVTAATGEAREEELDAKRGDGAIAASARANIAKPRKEEPPAPPPPAPAPVLPALAPAHADAVSAPPSSGRDPGYELASIGVGIEMGGRRLRYVDALTPGLRDYSVAAAPLATVRAALYPLADASKTVDVGIVGAYARAFALGSSATGVGSVDTTWWRFHAGGVMRVRTPSVVFALGSAYGAETFDFGSSPIDAQAPGVAYRFLRVSGDARIPLGRFAILAGAGYDALFSTGSVADRFRRATVGGVEGTLGVTFRVTRSIEAALGASYRRFFYAMHPVPGDALVAGGALDELYGLQGGVAYAF